MTGCVACCEGVNSSSMPASFTARHLWIISILVRDLASTMMSNLAAKSVSMASRTPLLCLAHPSTSFVWYLQGANKALLQANLLRPVRCHVGPEACLNQKLVSFARANSLQASCHLLTLWKSLALSQSSHDESMYICEGRTYPKAFFLIDSSCTSNCSVALGGISATPLLPYACSSRPGDECVAILSGSTVIYAM